MNSIKLKIDLRNGIIELEGNEEFAKAELPKILALLEQTAKSTPKSKTEICRNEQANDQPTSQETKADLGSFLARANPETHNEIVAAFAYFCAFLDQPHGAEFKNEEVVKLFNGPVRRSKPSEATKLCANCANERRWVRAGSKKGFWQISNEGQKYIEAKLSTDTKSAENST